MKEEHKEILMNNLIEYREYLDSGKDNLKVSELTDIDRKIRKWGQILSSNYRRNKLSDEKVYIIQDICPELLRDKLRSRYESNEEVIKELIEFINRNHRAPLHTTNPLPNEQRLSKRMQYIFGLEKSGKLGISLRDKLTKVIPTIFEEDFRVATQKAIYTGNNYIQKNELVAYIQPKYISHFNFKGIRTVNEIYEVYMQPDCELRQELVKITGINVHSDYSVSIKNKSRSHYVKLYSYICKRIAEHEYLGYTALCTDIFGSSTQSVNEKINNYAKNLKENEEIIFNLLSPREAKVIKERYFSHKMLKDVASDQNVTPAMIATVHNRALEKLRNKNIAKYIINSKEESENIERLEKANRDIRIENMNLSTRSYNCLKRAQLNNIVDILNYKKENGSLESIRNLGKAGIQEIEAKIAQLK